MEIQAAAISLQGVGFMIVVVEMDLVKNSGEADMAIDSLSPKFSGVPVVLMAQRDDGSPNYYGDQAIVSLLGDVPVDEMPWKEYSISA